MSVQVSDIVDVIETPERRIIDLAQRDAAPFLSLGRYRYLRALEPLPPQLHSSLLMLGFPLRGVAPYVVDDIDRHAAPGTVICIPPGHVYLTGKAAQPRGEFAWAIVHTNHPSLGPADPIRRAIDALCDCGAATWPIGAEITDEVRRAFDLAASESGWAVDAEVRHRLCAILFRLVGATTLKEPDSADPVHRGVQQALSWIDGHLGEVATVADMVAISGLSNTRFFDAFKAATGTSPKDYLMRRKTDLAREWLARDDEVTVTRVAHALGFSSSQQFATVFRRYQGTTPRAVRDSTSPL